MNNPVVQISHLSKKYKGAMLPAIDDLNLEITEGSVFGLLGPNGAGKSSLVMMMCGLIRPDSGDISLLGKKIKTEAHLIRKEIGVAPQEIALFPNLTARENLHYFGRMYGLQTDIISERITHFLNVFDLTGKANKQVHTFSGGMKRRLNLIAALLHQPRVLILDEPTAGVDVQSRTMILDFLSGLSDSKTTIIYTSHFLAEAERICTHLAIIDEGKLLTGGTSAEVMARYPKSDSLEHLFLHLTGKTIRD